MRALCPVARDWLVVQRVIRGVERQTESVRRDVVFRVIAHGNFVFLQSSYFLEVHTVWRGELWMRIVYRERGRFGKMGNSWGGFYGLINGVPRRGSGLRQRSVTQRYGVRIPVGI